MQSYIICQHKELYYLHVLFGIIIIIIIYYTLCSSTVRIYRGQWNNLCIFLFLEGAREMQKSQCIKFQTSIYKSTGSLVELLKKCAALLMKIFFHIYT